MIINDLGLFLATVICHPNQTTSQKQQTCRFRVGHSGNNILAAISSRTITIKTQQRKRMITGIITIIVIITIIITAIDSNANVAVTTRPQQAT